MYSLELCGGTHVRQTGDIGVFITMGDSASSAGVRRIEALTGDAAFAHLSAQSSALAEVATELKSQPDDVPARVKALLEERKSLSNVVAQLRRQLAMANGSGGVGGSKTRKVGNTTFLAQILNGVSGKELPSLIDEHKSQLGSGAVLLLSETDGKVAICAGVTDDLTGSLSAVDLVKAAVPFLGGKGGEGRPDMARGGGNDLSHSKDAIKAADAIIEGAQ